MSTTAPTTRFPRWLYAHGNEPDPRFSLANERTFLAWIRTGLALIAAGVALQALALSLQPELRTAASLVLVVTGTFACGHSWTSWYANERALRLGQPLPSSQMSLPVALAGGLAGSLVVLALLLR